MLTVLYLNDNNFRGMFGLALIYWLYLTFYSVEVYTNDSEKNNGLQKRLEK